MKEKLMEFKTFMTNHSFEGYDFDHGLCCVVDGYMFTVTLSDDNTYVLTGSSGILMSTIWLDLTLLPKHHTKRSFVEEKIKKMYDALEKEGNKLYS